MRKKKGLVLLFLVSFTLLSCAGQQVIPENARTVKLDVPGCG